MASEGTGRRDGKGDCSEVHVVRCREPLISHVLQAQMDDHMTE